MMSSLYIGATGLKTHGEGLGVVGHNIANVSTIGYKQQSMQFDDIFYANLPPGGGWESQEGARVALSQLGMGSRPGAVRTLFATEGPIESGTSIFDMAILGKGFFQVTDPNTNIPYYTRAGNFRLDNTGTLRDANNYTVTGIPINPEQGAPLSGPLSGGGPITIDVFGTIPPKASSQLAVYMNLGFTQDATQSTTDPYFSLLQSWQSTATPPLGTNSYGFAQAIKLYDAAGNSHELTLYLDAAPDTAQGRMMEFILAETPPNPASALPGEGLRMAGTLSFDKSGQLTGMSAFTPNGVSQTLSDWTPAQLAGGLPQFELAGSLVTLNLGVSGQGGWQQAPASAADVGLLPGRLPTLAQAQFSPRASTAYPGSTSLRGLEQNGYAEGRLMDIEINAKGVVTGVYSNAQNLDLYQIPLCRFTSEDGLHYEGKNLFSATPGKTGTMEMGVPDTENYGAIMADHIEGSNVDLSREITLLIIMQRGFQMNSKTITTSDTMLQRAIELKRN